MIRARARRSAGVIVGLAGLLGGALVGYGTTATAATGPGASPPAHTGQAMPTRSGTPTPHQGNPAGSAQPGQGSPPGSGNPPPGDPRFQGNQSPRNGQNTPPRNPNNANPAPGGRNDRNPTWRHDSRGWHDWDAGWNDPGFRREHSRDSRHDHFEDRDRHFHDEFHFDEFRSEDRDFRHDCDTLISIHSVRALLDFLDGNDSLRDFFEMHGDLYDFLVHHPDEFDDFDTDCTFIDLHS